MKFSKKFQTNLIIFIVLLSFVAVVYYIWKIIPKREPFAQLGYADIEDEYVMPKVYENIITQEEVEYIFAQSKDKFVTSTVIKESDSGLDKNRKSETFWLPKTDPVGKNIIQRICNIEGHPLENAEDLQVVKYTPNGYYNAHHDTCCHDDKPSLEFLKRGGHRIRTMLIYLNEDFDEGETHFPKLNQKIKAPKYGGIMFHPLDKSGTKCHPKALHAGLPVKSGEKYIANVWIRQSTFI